MATIVDDEFDPEASARAAAEERKIRDWFARNASDPDFITSVKIVARDLGAAKAYGAGTVSADPHDVTLTLGSRKMRIPLSRWKPLIQRGYVENSTRPALTEKGERILQLYTQLLQQTDVV